MWTGTALHIFFYRNRLAPLACPTVPVIYIAPDPLAGPLHPWLGSTWQPRLVTSSSTNSGPLSNLRASLQGFWVSDRSNEASANHVTRSTAGGEQRTVVGPGRNKVLRLAVVGGARAAALMELCLAPRHPVGCFSRYRGPVGRGPAGGGSLSRRGTRRPGKPSLLGSGRGEPADSAAGFRVC
jgi:hypothetical protein